jgi:transposase InsO family protein
VLELREQHRLRVTGHAVTGDRRRTAKQTDHPLGHDYFHAVVDDHSRLAYGELLANEKADTVTALVARALTWFAAHGITCRRVMTDGAWSYTHNIALRELFTEREIRHIVTPPYTPRWNGKVERFHQTWNASGLRLRCRNGTARNRALPRWLEHYNQRRPHSSLGGQHRSAALTTSQGRTAS